MSLLKQALDLIGDTLDKSSIAALARILAIHPSSLRKGLDARPGLLERVLRASPVPLVTDGHSVWVGCPDAGTARALEIIEDELARYGPISRELHSRLGAEATMHAVCGRVDGLELVRLRISGEYGKGGEE